MRKIIILFTILLSVSTFAQRGFMAGSVGFDVKNTFSGSKPTNNEPSADLLFQFKVVGNKGMEVGIGYEIFPRIDFSKYTMSYGYNFPLYGYIKGHEIKTNVFVNIEPTIINRWGNWGGGISYTQNSSFLSVGANVGARWFFDEHLGIETQYNVLPRQDSAAMYGNVSNHKVKIGDAPVVGSFYVSLIYKIDR